MLHDIVHPIKSSFLTARFLKLRKNFRTEVFDGEFRKNGVLGSLGSRNSTSRNFLRSFFERFCGIFNKNFKWIINASIKQFRSYHWIYYNRFGSVVAYIFEMIVLHLILTISIRLKTKDCNRILPLYLFSGRELLLRCFRFRSLPNRSGKDFVNLFLLNSPTLLSKSRSSAWNKQSYGISVL